MRASVMIYKTAFDSGRWYDAREELLEALPELLDELEKLKGQVARLSKAYADLLRGQLGAGLSLGADQYIDIEKRARKGLGKILRGPD